MFIDEGAMRRKLYFYMRTLIGSESSKKHSEDL